MALLTTIKRSSLFNKTSFYGFELFMAVFGLTTAAAIADYGIFAIFNYLRGIDGSASEFVGEFSLWIVAGMLVWLPLSLLFYIRSRGEQARRKTVSSSTVHKVILSLYFFINIVIAAGAAFATLYSLLRLAIGDTGGDSVIDVLVRVTVPAIVMAKLHIWLLVAFTTNKYINRKTFAGIFAAFGVAVMVLLTIVSISSVRGYIADEKRQDDLRVISQKIDEHAEEDGLPASLNDLSLDDELQLPADTYTYKKDDQMRYQLCAEFTHKTNGYDESYAGEDEYVRYGNFYNHDEGNECFKLRTQFNVLGTDYSDMLEELNSQE